MNYWIDQGRGIYRTENSYHDDVDYIYVVDFDKPDVDKQFRNFLDIVEENGKRKGMRELKAQFRGLRDLLS